ncbi:MAG: hypothetical protein K0S36_193 [Nitrosospira multiformis]|jgi:hypothetical protein|nr:hypothetical protein [Nitrosospira multiformis]
MAIPVISDVANPRKKMDELDVDIILARASELKIQKLVRTVQ